MYTGPRLIELLEKQHQRREAKLLPEGKPLSGLLKKGTFTIQWRAKVGSFPHPDLETIVSAGEPCGSWRPSQGRIRRSHREITSAILILVGMQLVAEMLIVLG